MSGIIALLIANFFVVDYGVMPDGKESSVYVIQIEPELAEQLVEGYVIESVIPPEFSGIRKFRIQIGNEILTKPTPLLVAPEVDDVAVPDGPETPSEVLDGEDSDIDVDAFPLQTEPVTDQQAETLQLIPDEIDTAELPGIPVGPDTNDQGVREVFEPDVTLLPQLAQAPTEIELPAVVIEPVFDNINSDVVVQTPKDFERSENSELDFLNNGDADDRVVLEELPDLESSSDENVVSVGALDGEPELLQDNEAEFVRLANAMSSDTDVPNRVSNVAPNKPLPPESRSWPLFSITLLGLLVSVGGNVFLGMTVLDFYRKRKGASSDMPTPKDTISE
ncbi:MAG: hypothetical protein NZ807_02350 [Dehalococcoidia bacterium]|nr:hypothetical protein [Dehalococcoidia bacterium]